MLLGLADVLFAYAYDHRTTEGDASVESAWTVAVLSPLLSWLEVRTHMRSIFTSKHSCVFLFVVLSACMYV